MARHAKDTLECCGFTKVTDQGQMQVPKDARDALGFTPGTRLIVFARPATGELVVTVKPLDQDLHDLATRRARKSAGQ